MDIVTTLQHVKHSVGSLQVNAAKCKEIIVENASTCLRQPDLYAGQDIEAQMIDLMFSEFFNGGDCLFI